MLKRVLGALALLLLLAFAIVSAVYYYEFPGYCRRLESRARRPEVQHALESWVAINWTGERIPLNDTLLGDGIGPGFRWLTAKFDGTMLAMGPQAHVRLLGVEARDALADAIAPSVQAIYFTERSRFGVLVQLPDRELYSTSVFDLTPVSGTISVLCEK